MHRIKNLTNEQSNRLKKLIYTAVIIFIAGLVYGYIIIPAGFHVLCPIHFITGLDCPFCGMTRICLSILHFNFNFIHYNYGLIVIGPMIGILAIFECINYVIGAKAINTKVLKVLILIILVIWFILRNLMGI